MTTVSSSSSSPSPVDPEPTPPPRGRRSRFATFGLVLAAVLLGLVAARFLVSTFQPHLYSGTVLQSPAPAPAMEGLTLASGEPFDITAYDGDVVLLYFGYTNCPDVCPTTLSDAARVRASLSGDDRDRTHLIMVSVDPARDRLPDLQSYVEFFDPDFLGLGGSADDIHTAATKYGIYYVLNEGDVETGYTVDHTANLLGVGPDGRLRVVWAPDVSSDDLAADIQELLG